MASEHSPAPRVLIVEDERLIRWSLCQALEAAGATVVDTAGAAVAMEVLRAQTRGFDAAVLDVHLPDGDGLGLLATIRWRWPGTRVLIMTAFDSPELRAQAAALGAAGVVGKPFDLDTVTDLVLHQAPAA